MDWADGFVVVYNISDRTSFVNAKNILRQIREARIDNCKGSETPQQTLIYYKMNDRIERVLSNIWFLHGYMGLIAGEFG